jgi:hypothetical protein
LTRRRREMTEVLVFKFPNLSDNARTEIERTYCELINDYRNGATLDPEVLDWMDSANNFLITMESA